MNTSHYYESEEPLWSDASSHSDTTEYAPLPDDFDYDNASQSTLDADEYERLANQENDFGLGNQPFGFANSDDSDDSDDSVTAVRLSGSSDTSELFTTFEAMDVDSEEGFPIDGDQDDPMDLDFEMDEDYDDPMEIDDPMDVDIPFVMHIQHMYFPQIHIQHMYC